MLVSGQYSDGVYRLESTFSEVWIVFVLFGGILFLVSVIMFANFIATNISDKRKDIGIIRAIGGSRRDIFKIFIAQGILFALLTSVLTLSLSLMSVPILNGIYATDKLSGLRLLFFFPWNLLLIPMIGFISMLIASFFPIRKMSALTPVEVIRGK
jgi:putative ABC transport system permease protein